MRISDWSSDVCSSDLRGSTTSFREVEDGRRYIRANARISHAGDLRSAARAGELGLSIRLRDGLECPPIGVVADLRLSAIGPEYEPSSEERRVGKECVSTVRSRWVPVH